MAYGQWSAVIQAIRDVLDDGHGSIRTLATGRLVDDLPEGIAEEELQRRGLGEPAPFRVRVTRVEPSPYSAPINSGTILRDFDVEVTISRTISLPERLSPDDMAALQALCLEDQSAVSQALGSPPNLSQTASGTDTNIAGGALRYLGSDNVVTTSATDEARRLETTHRFTGVLKVYTASVGVLLLETGDHLKTEDGSFILV